MNNHPGFMVEGRRFSKTSLDLNGKLNIRIQQTLDGNTSWVGYIEDPRRTREDDIGALYYVVAVIFIYGLSIVMMIASHIRKNKQDNQLRTYLKEMAKLRKNDRREKVLSKINDIAKNRQRQEARQKLQSKLANVDVDAEADSETCQPLMVKEDTNEDTNDSVFLQPVSSITPDPISPSLSDCRFNADSVRTTSLSFHDNGRRKSTGSKSTNFQNCRTMRLHQGPYISFSDQRSVVSPCDSSSPNLSDFRSSPVCGRERAASVHVAHPYSWTTHKPFCPNEIKVHKISENKQSTKIGETKKKDTWSESFHVVEEDADL